MGNSLNISTRAFWDIKTDELDPAAHKEFIVRRVFENGKWKDVKNVIQYYSYDDVQQTLLNLDSMSEKGLNLSAIIFDMPKNNFKCFTNKPFRPSYTKH